MEKKSLLIRLVALVAAVMCASGASAYDFYLNGIYYNIKENNTVEVTYKEVTGTDTTRALSTSRNMSSMTALPIT